MPRPRTRGYKNWVDVRLVSLWRAPRDGPGVRADVTARTVAAGRGRQLPRVSSGRPEPAQRHTGKERSGAGLHQETPETLEYRLHPVRVRTPGNRWEPRSRMTVSWSRPESG